MNRNLPQTVLKLPWSIFSSGFKPRVPAVVTDGLKSEGKFVLTYQFSCSVCG